MNFKSMLDKNELLRCKSNDQQLKSFLQAKNIFYCNDVVTASLSLK